MDKDELLGLVLKDIKQDLLQLKADFKGEMNDLKIDVKELLEFKWKIYGMSSLLSLIAGASGAGIVLRIFN